MTLAETWNQEYQRLGSTRDMVEWIRGIQLDSYRQAVQDAIQTVSNGPLNPGVLRTLYNPRIRTLVQAYQQGQADVLDDFCKKMQGMKILRTLISYPNDESAPFSNCACVHHDPYECARIRDGRHNSGDDDYHKRSCECECHKDYQPEEFD